MKRIPRLLYTGLTVLTLSVAMAVTTAASASAATTDKNCTVSTPINQRPQLRLGDTGTCVTVLQGLLANVKTFHGTYTRSFGSVTDAAVRQAQSNGHISVDGIVGPVTWTMLAKSSPATKRATTTSNSPTRNCDNQHYRTICVIKGDNGSAATLYAIENGVVKKTFTDVRTSDSRNPNSDPYKVTSEGRLKVVNKAAGNDYALYYDDYSDTTNGSNGQQAIRWSTDFQKCGYDGNLSGTKCVIDHRGAAFGGVDIRRQSDAQWLWNWSNTGTEIVILHDRNATV